MRQDDLERESRSAEPGDLEFQASLVRAIHEASPDGILVVDENDIVVSHNRRFIEVWQIPGYLDPTLAARGSAIGMPDQNILSLVVQEVRDPEAFLARVRELYANPALDDHCEIALRDGRTVERHSTVLRGEKGRYLGRVWFFRDITARQQTEAALRDLAEHDFLTGVANRRYFLTRASQEFARARRYGSAVSLISLDIDHFKRINDSFGHAAGDEVLRALCVTCGTQLRQVDLLGRLGGEEFAVLLPDTTLDQARVLAERLRQRVMELEVMIATGKVACTVSAGVSTVAPGDSDIDDVMRRADEALYRAKEGGRNRVEGALPANADQ